MLNVDHHAQIDLDISLSYFLVNYGWYGLSNTAPYNEMRQISSTIIHTVCDISNLYLVVKYVEYSPPCYAHICTL